MKLKFAKELYSRVALIKAAYNFTDLAFIHLDADSQYFYADLKMKDSADPISEDEFVNEMLTQSVRHEVYQQTKDIRELIVARAMATSVVYKSRKTAEQEATPEREHTEDEILKDWFLNEKTEA